tara:strand:- start:2050 stop:3993 length:1944 start_codon:yes stop_codon:yes gene_type:complete
MVKRVALLNAGGQQNDVVRRRVGELGYEIREYPIDLSVNTSYNKGPTFHEYDPEAVIISGGPSSVYADDARRVPDAIWRAGIPTLGICYGMQDIADRFGGNVVRGLKGQYGRADIAVTDRSSPLFKGLEPFQRVLMSHFDRVDRVPDGFEVCATSDGMIAGMQNNGRRIYATQFHPEQIPNTEYGMDILSNFLIGICKFPKMPRKGVDHHIQDALGIIRDTVGSDKRVLHYLSWGVDSTVMASLLQQVVEPDRLYMRTLDTGTMRKGEIDRGIRMAGQLGLPNYTVHDYAQRFSNAVREINTSYGRVSSWPLWTTINAKHKRDIFSAEYGATAREEIAIIARGLGISRKNVLLGQGTLAPDMIESGLTGGESIKQHHNTGPAMDGIDGVYPLQHLFKDQVREIARALGLSDEFAYKQPFPGPGGLVRVVGYDGAKLDSKYTKLESKIVDEGVAHGLNVNLLPVRTVGVQGDERSYKYAAVVSGDVSWEKFAQFSRGLPNEFPVNRVWYASGPDLTRVNSRESTKTLMTRDVMDQFREADAVATEIAGQYKFEGHTYNDSRACSQMPISIVPLPFGNNGNRSVVIRPTHTHDFMASIGMMPVSGRVDKEHFPEDMWLQMAEEIPRRVPGISRVILDPTDKPPATTELE